MAEATQPTAPDQATAAAAPAAPAPEPPKGRAILENAKQELKAIRDQGPPPAEEQTPEPAAAPPPDAPVPPKEEGSRRQEGQRLREQIRREVQQEFQAKQEAEARQRQSAQQQREFDELMQRADAGDWDSKERVLSIIKGNRGMQAAIMEGRNTVLAELGRDITSAIYGLEVDEDGQQALLKAPSVAEFGKTAFDQGRRVERAVHESTIATLKAENESLKGRLAGNGPSPTPTNGSVTSPRGSNGKFRSMREAFEASASELGYRTQG